MGAILVFAIFLVFHFERKESEEKKRLKWLENCLFNEKLKMVYLQNKDRIDDVDSLINDLEDDFFKHGYNKEAFEGLIKEVPSSENRV